MKLRIWASFISLMLSLCGFAQNVTVRVSVKNEKNESAQNATVQVLRSRDSAFMFMKIQKGNSTSFSLRKNSVYLLKITSVSIEEVFQKIRTGNNDTLINIVAKTASSNLAAVTVTGKSTFIKQEDDKTIIDVEPLASSSINAYEVLEKTPGAIVDQDGNIYLNSATPATVYINGREVKLSATDLASLLKSLPANSISKVEILRNPSAKYDAASSGGIVNLVLKKGVKLGTNGSIDMAFFQGKYSTELLGFSVNNSSDKFNTYLTYNFTNRSNFDMLSSSRLLRADTSFIQSSLTKYPSDNNYAGAGLDYRLSKKWSIAYDARMSANNGRSHVHNDINLQSVVTGYIKGQNLSLVNNTGPSFYLSNSVSSKYTIDTLGSEWTNSLEYNYYHANNRQQYDNIHILPAANTLVGIGSILNNKNITAFKSDLVLKFKNKITLEAGTKLSFSISSNNAKYFLDSGMGKSIDRMKTNAFHYGENIGAVYLQVSKKFGGLTVKPGLRFEYTDISGHQFIPMDTTFSIKRTDLFPYIYLRHKLAKMMGFTLSGNLIYRRSITRPYYEALNPFPRYADQYTYDVGNPQLQPQFTDNYEFNINADDFPVFSVGLNDIQNIFTNLTYAKGDTLFRTYDNLGRNKEIYMRLVGGIPPGKKYFFYAGTQLNIINYLGQYDGYPFKYHRASWNFFMFQNYKPSKTLTLTLNGWMRVNGVVNFFELKTFGSLNLSANKSIFNKKVNIVFSVNDLLHTNKNEFSIDQPNFSATGSRYGDTRKVGIALKYNFGRKPREEKKENFQEPTE